MDVLRFLESIRTPFFNTVLNALTYLGDEIAFLGTCLIVFWCFCKQEGYFLITGGLGGTIINQFLKILCRVPRPWVVDENFTIVESARSGAAGYSFPSGHSANAVNTFGGIALWTKRVWARVVFALLAVIVCFSRMYLGVHTPLDVGVGAACALVLIIALRPLMKKNSPKINRVIFAVLLCMAAANLMYVTLYQFPADVDQENYAEALKNAYTLFGCAAGLVIAHEIEYRFVRFETKAVWWAQLLKIAGGLVVIMALRIGLKAVLTPILGAGSWADCIRYFVMVVVAIDVWPLTFRWFGKLGKK